MFFPKAMTEIELIVPSKDLLAVTKILSRHGVFHQTDSNYAGVDSGSASAWQDNAAAYAALERRVQAVMQALDVEEGPPPSAEFESMVELDAVRPVVDRLEEEVKKTSDELVGEKKRLEQLESTLHQLEPVAEVEINISALRKSNYLYSVLGLIPAANVDRLKTSLARVPYVFLVLRPDSQKPVVWLAGPRGNSDVLDRATRSAYLNPLVLPEEYDGTPAEVIKSLRDEMEKTRQRISELQTVLAQFGESRKEQLRNLLWEVHASRLLAEAIVRFGQLRHTYVIVGWVPADDLETLTQRLKYVSKEILIEALPISRTGHNQHVPVALLNNKYLKPFQMLVNTYARPRYGELDPTIIVAFTFPILYGAMFGDIGQGLVLALFGWLLASKKIKKLSGMAGLGGVIMAVGIMAALFGILYGSFFAFEGELAEKYLGFAIHPLWLSPIHEILPVLSLSIDVGIVLLLAGFVLSIFNQARARDLPHLIFGHTGLVSLIFYIWFLGIMGIILGKTQIAPRIAVAVASLPDSVIFFFAGVFAILVMFSGFFRNLMGGHRPLIEGNIGTYIFGSFMELFEVAISMISNTLSYVRVGAFAVAHGGLSLAFFKIAGEEPNLGFWITILAANAFFVIIEALIVGIQTMRLHYYEFLGKFFTGGGMRFEPLTITPAKEEG
ncbi:MAG: V-type ATP synthase subunit I [Chloroflexota bacterium]